MEVDFVVTLVRRGKEYNVPIIEFYGLSTDEKPKYDDSGAEIPNGSIFLEMDTLNVFFYDTVQNTWISG